MECPCVQGQLRVPMGLFHGAASNRASSMLPGLTRGYRAGSGVGAPQGASELGRGAQATAGETGTHAWAGGGGGTWEPCLGWRLMSSRDQSPGNLSWGGVPLRSQALVVESVLGEPWGRAMCQCRGAMGQ